MENRNTIIAVVLMLVVWLGFSFLFPPQRTQEAVPSAPAPKTQATAPAPGTVTATPPAVSSPPPAQTAQVKEIVVENELYRTVLSTSGGRVVSLQLKNFSLESGGKKAISLVDHAAQVGTLGTSGVEGFQLPPDTVFHTDAPESVRLKGGESRQLVFRTRLPNGLDIEKVFSFHGNKYQTDLRLRVVNAGSAPVRGALQVSLAEPWNEDREESQFEFVGPTVMVGDDVETVKVKDLQEKPQSYGSGVIWSAFVDMYFMRALVPLEGAAASGRLEKSGNFILNTLVTPLKTVAPGESVTFSYMAYFGPKDLDILKAIDHQLAEVIDFGIFSFLAKPLLQVLKYFYTFLGNYGLAIILLTVIIKLLFWPLTNKSYASMKAMSKLQPQMQKLRDKHKNDRDKLNREIMELYKNNRVNPLGGCLPMLVQIPVFFALYKVLLNSIELRHAPFYLWIQDLSAKDPYYVTPLIMGATMFIQQKMTPSTMDPIQAKIFLLMPIIFTFMFLNFPSGLVIYWLVNNVLTIGQQFYINRKAA